MASKTQLRRSLLQPFQDLIADRAETHLHQCCASPTTVQFHIASVVIFALEFVPDDSRPCPTTLRLS